MWPPPTSWLSPGGRSPPRAVMNRRWWVAIALVIVLLVLPLAAWFVVGRPFDTMVHWVSGGGIDIEVPDPFATPVPSWKVSEEWSAHPMDRRGANGQMFSYHCSPNGTPGTIWGSDIYSDDSPVCTAAVHAGLITLAEGGTVTIQIRPGRASYEATLRNGIESQPWEVWEGSYVFVLGAP